MSNALRLLRQLGEGVDTGNKEFRVKAGGVDDCIILKITNSSGNGEKLELKYGSSGSSFECNRLKELIDPAVFPIPIGGKLIST